MALKLEKKKVAHLFQVSTPCPFLPSVTTDDRKAVSMPKYSLKEQALTIIFEFQLM